MPARHNHKPAQAGEYRIFSGRPEEAREGQKRPAEPECAAQAAETEVFSAARVIEISRWEDLKLLKKALAEPDSEGGRKFAIARDTEPALKAELKEFFATLRGKPAHIKEQLITDKLNLIPGNLDPKDGRLSLRGIGPEDLIVDGKFKGPRFDEVYKAVRDAFDSGLDSTPTVAIKDNIEEERSLQPIIVNYMLGHIRSAEPQFAWMSVRFVKHDDGYAYRGLDDKLY